MLQKNATPKSNHGKGKPAPSGAFTHRIREDGEVFSGEEGRDTSSDTTPLPPWQDLFACDRLTAIARQQFAAQQTELATLSKRFALQQKTIADLEKINRDLEKVLSNMASQMASTSEATQTALAAILARLEAGPVASQVVVPNNKDYPPLPPTGATPKSKTMATKPNSNIATTTTTTTTH
ncbi:hypothetical protein BASA81_016123 [Batrachochytrium salamandrivorans]|nr:hypothetical protein BASA81_016123 [Batrachochytrium salamandrivorans]